MTTKETLQEFFDNGVRRGRQTELNDVIARLKFIMAYSSPFGEGRPALRRLLIDLQDGKHYGEVDREAARTKPAKRPARKPTRKKAS